MKCFVTGGAGFVGSHLVDRLMTDGHSVVVYDNLSLGREDFIRHHYSTPVFKFIKGDVLDPDLLRNSMMGSDVVFHLAANSDIVKSAKDTRIDLDQGTIATYNVLVSMRDCGTNKIVFTSSNVVYGEVEKLPIREDYGPLFPISFYGASKLAGEGLISAFCHNFNFRSWIYRFANVIGPRVTHGVVLDFYRKLRKNSKELEVLGDGNQAKPYIHVHDVADGMLFGFTHCSDAVNYFNLATDGLTPVTVIAHEVTRLLGLRNVELKFTGGVRGWPGDVSRVSLDMTKLKSLGWKPKYPSSDQACRVGAAAIIEELEKARTG
jgi:UDP-glucose 4-epimerase